MTDTETAQRKVQVGDFFVESWGYDQTNVDYYQVTRISTSGKTLWMRHVQSGIVKGGDGGPQDYVAPIPDAFGGGYGNRDGELKKRIRYYNGCNGPAVSVHMTSYSDAYLWDCKPHYQTGANWGH